VYRTSVEVVRVSRVGFFLAGARDIAMRPALSGSIYKFSTTSLSCYLGSALGRPERNSNYNDRSTISMNQT
jgi:hypothetical protein